MNVKETVKSFDISKSFSDKLIYETENIDISTKGLGYIGVTLENDTDISEICVYFITEEDQRYNEVKSVKVEIAPNCKEEKTYILDISRSYGFCGKLKRIKIECNSFAGGEIKLIKAELYKGGSLIAPFTLSEKKISATRQEIVSKTPCGQSWFPDGIMGIMNNGDGTLNFISSSPIDKMKTGTIFRGTADKPVQTFIKDGIGFENVKQGYGIDEFNYVSLGQIYRFGNDECLSIIHLEQHFDNEATWDENLIRTHTCQACGFCTLGLGYSPDNGETWYFCGEVATHSAQRVHRYYGMGEYKINGNNFTRDIGNGAFVIKDGYMYMYIMDAETDCKFSFAVLRASLDEVIAAAREKSATDKPELFKKYYNGSFSEPGINGKSTSIVDDVCPANFCTIVYSDYLDKYILARCASVVGSPNDGDIVLNISSDPTNFKGDNYFIDASPGLQQYPTLVGDSDNPGFITGKKVYLYYIDAVEDDDFLWNKANLAQRVITFD